MKKYPVLFLLLFIVFNGNAQQDTTKKKVISPRLMETKSIVDLESHRKNTWSLAFVHDHSEYNPIQARDVKFVIDSFINQKITIDERKGEVAEYNLVKKYEATLDSIFDNLTLFGTQELGMFFATVNQIPVRFFYHTDSSLSMMITGISFSATFNTLKLTARQRAAKVLTSYLLTRISVLSKWVTSKEIKYVGFSAVYGSKDFSSSSSFRSTEAEVISFVAPVSKIKQYVEGSLTEDELVGSMDIYLADRDMIGPAKKINIVLE